MKMKHTLVLFALLFSLATLSTASAQDISWHEFGQPLELQTATTQDKQIPINLEQGSLEFQFKPKAGDTSPRQVLQLTSGTGFKLDLRFHPSGNRWIFRLQDKTSKELIIWHNLAIPGKWNHIVVTWDKNTPGGGKINVYANGAWRATQPYEAGEGDKATLTLGNAKTPAAVGFSDWVMYSRALTESQVEYLSKLDVSLAERQGSFADRLKEDDQKIAARKKAIAQLKGKVGHIIHMKGTQPKEIELPEGIIAQSIRPEDMDTVDLSQYSVLFFPPGPRYKLTDSDAQKFKEYVKNGGGYVGVCQGAYYAAESGLLDMDVYASNVWGIFKIRLTPNLLTDGRKEEISMHFGNGPIMVPRSGCKAVATYVMTLPGKAIPGAIIVGEYGKGRIVVFGPHPRGGTVSSKGTRAHWTGTLLDTERMLVNALLYAESNSKQPLQ